MLTRLRADWNQRNTMRRLALLTILLTALSVVGSLGFLRAFSDEGHPFATTWCDAPVVVPLVSEGDDGAVSLAPGVSLAGRAEAVVGIRGPALRLDGAGSRAQVDLGQPLFHTQWLFSQVSEGDAVRVDAFVDSALAPVTASSVRGALRPAEIQPTNGLLAGAVTDPTGTGEVDLFTGATSVLFTNEGASSVEVIAAIGCSALQIETELLSAPSWDEASQRFVAEHRVTISNQLATTRLGALRSVNPGVASSSIEDVSINLNLAAIGFSGAEVIDVVGVGALDAPVNTFFDGRFATSLFADPLRLADGTVEEFTFAVAYEPDFEDPTWADGVVIPEPRISVLGQVDAVQVGVNDIAEPFLHPIDRAVSSPDLETPEPGITLDLTEVAEPELTSAGRVRLSHELTLANSGETTIDRLAVDYPLVELFGPGTVIESVQAVGQGVCEAPVSTNFNGAAASTVLFDADGIGVGERCTISVDSTVIPGTQPTASGTTFDAPLTVTARSGARVVRDEASLRTRLFQDVDVQVEVVETVVTNLQDGGHRVEGTIVISNDGALDVGGLSTILDVLRPADGGGQDAAPVFFDGFVGDETCLGAGPPGGARSSVFVSGGATLAASSSCTVTFSFVAFPGGLTQDWEIVARVAAPVTAVQPDVAAAGSTSVDFSEAPGVESAIEIESITNNADGTYTVRAVSIATNTGDTPLITVSVDDSFADAFGEQLLAHDRVGDSCTGISTRFPLPTASIAPDANTCTVTTESVVRPGADLDGSAIDLDVVATPTSLVEVASSATSETVGFTEATRLISLISVESVERIDEASFAFILDGTIENTGDVEARDVQVQLDLDDAFSLDSGDIPYDVQFLGVTGLADNERFDGAIFNGLFNPGQTIAAGAQVGFRVLINAQPGDAPGPYNFSVSSTATSPALADFSTRSSSDSTTVPIIRSVARSLDFENNNDGTYSITHSVEVENVGTERLPSVQVFTGFERAFSPILLGEVNVVSTCTEAVAAGDRCSVTRTATVRPGSAIGPYDIGVSIAATSNGAVEALVLPTPESVVGSDFDASPLTFDEDPGLQVATNVGAFENNGDGTYTLTYGAEVTNTGDVPLYRVGLNDFVGDTYAGTLVSNLIAEDTCAAVTFANSLAPTVSCEQTRTVTIRPLTNLGPWEPQVLVTAESPAFAVIEGASAFDSVTFTEEVAVDIEATLAAGINNGNGTYIPEYALVLTNAGDVPLIEVQDAVASLGFGDALLNVETTFDSCGVVSFETPLLPGQECRVEQSQLISAGTNLGPFALDNQTSVRSASGQIVRSEVTTNEITLAESPELELESSVLSVESTGAGQFRVVMDLSVRNGGDVRIDDLALQLDLDQIFPDTAHRIEGAVSNDLLVSEAFTAGESTSLLTEGQSLPVDTNATLFLVIAVEPGTDVGPFVGDLRAEGLSPAATGVSAVVNVTLELPSVAVSVVAQSIENNRDGSYTVTSSYEVTNDGTTDLEFVRLNEDLATIYAGTNVQVLSIAGDGLPAADPADGQRGNNLVEWGASLASGDSAVMTSTVLVEPGNILGPFQPAVSAVGAAPTGTETAAVATATDLIEFVEQPALRVEQRLVGRPIWDGDRFEVSFDIDVVNDGDVELRGVQVREDLLQALGANSEITVVDIRSESLTPNTRYDGRGSLPNADGTPSTSTRDIGDTRLLSGLDTLAAGATASIQLDLILQPETRGVLSTRAVVSARTPAGADLGAADQEIEANTLTRLSVQGELGVAKQVVGDAVLQADGSISVTYEILVENAGPFPLDNVTVHDQLSQSFGLGSSFEIAPVRIVSGSPCAGAASPTYDGGTVDSVLVTGVELEPGERCRIQFDAVVVPSIPLPGPYRSSAFAIATDPFSGTVLDDSTDGTNTDPDGNQEPGDNDIATPVVLTIPEPVVEIDLEPLPSGGLDASGRFVLQYRITLENAGAINVESTRLTADLESQWATDFEVVSLESETLAVNNSFNGAGTTNLLDRAGVLVAGERYEVILTARVEQPDSGELALDLDFDGVSITGASVVSELAEPVLALGPDGAIQATLFDTLTVQEQRLLILGSGVIALFLALFVRSVVRKIRWFNDDPSPESGRELAASAESDEGWYIEPRVEERRRPAAPVIDLNASTEYPVLDLTDSSDLEPVIDLRTSSDPDRHRDEHHKARRRRGRRIQRRVD